MNEVVDSLAFLYKEEDLSYYDGEFFSKELDFRDSEKQFRMFYDFGTKSSLIVDLNLTDRSYHSMSLLFLGNIIRQKMGLDCGIYINRKVFPFQYYWAILCSYHDAGYGIENGDIKTTNAIISHNIKKKTGLLFEKTYVNSLFKFNYLYRRKFRNNYSIFSGFKNRNMKRISDDINNYFNGENNHVIDNEDYEIKVGNIIVRDSQYSFKLIDDYFYFREDYMNVIDHGIIGGMLLFDRFIELYQKKYFDNINLDFNKRYHSNFTYFMCDDYHEACIEQFPLFAYLADCIVSHNVFLPTEESLPVYKKYNIDALKNKQIDYAKNPLLYLLCFVDTIDPVKFFMNKYNGNYPINEILNSIGLEVDDKQKTITISKIESGFIKNPDHFKEYINKILELNDFLKIKIERKDDNNCTVYWDKQ